MWSINTISRQIIDCASQKGIMVNEGKKDAVVPIGFHVDSLGTSFTYTITYEIVLGNMLTII